MPINVAFPVSVFYFFVFLHHGYRQTPIYVHAAAVLAGVCHDILHSAVYSAHAVPVAFCG